MAITFNGTSEYYSAGSAAITATPLSVACWGAPTALALQTLFSIANNDGVSGGFLAMLNASGNVLARTKSSAGVSGAQSTATYSAGAWAHFGWSWASATLRTAYLNGGNKGTQTTSRTPSGLNTTAIATQLELSASNYYGGPIEGLGVWNVALTDDEFYSLSRGYSPLFIRPASLVHYFPLIANASELRAALAMSATGSPSAVSGAPIIYPSGPLYAKAGGLPAQKTALRGMERVYGNQATRLRGIEAILTGRCQTKLAGAEKIAGTFTTRLRGAESVQIAAKTQLRGAEMVGSHTTRLRGNETIRAMQKTALLARESVTIAAKTLLPGRESVTVAAKTILRGNEGIVLVPCRTALLARERIVGAQAVRCYKNTADGGTVDVDTPFATWVYGGPYVTPSLAFPFHHRFIVRRFNGYYEDKNLAETHLRLDGAGAQLANHPGEPSQFSATEGIDGSIEIRGAYFAESGEGVEPDSWALYWDAGTGTVNFGAALATAALAFDASGIARFYYRQTISSPGAYLFVLRTRVAAGSIESDNSDAAPAVTITAVSPAVPHGGFGRL